jgi:hypothetical protein
VLAAVGSLLLAACSVNTMDAVAPPSQQPSASSSQSGPEGAKPVPRPPGASPAGRGLGSGSDVTTYTSFAGPVSISVTEQHGFSSVVGEALPDGSSGVRLRLTGPMEYKDPATGATYASMFNAATKRNYIYHGSGTEYPVTVADTGPITGYFCGNLYSGQRSTRFCVARYDGTSWWHYYGGPDWRFDRNEPIPGRAGSGALCSSQATACIGGMETSANEPELVWNPTCAGDLLKDLSPGCVAPTMQSRISNAVLESESYVGAQCSHGSAFEPYACAVINILPIRQPMTFGPTTPFEVDPARGPWGKAIVCGNPRFRAEKGKDGNDHGSIVKTWPGEGGRNMVVLLRSQNGTSDTRISGVIEQDVSTVGDCGLAEGKSVVSNLLNWDPKSSGSAVPSQACQVFNGPPPQAGLSYDCTNPVTFVRRKDRGDQKETNDLLAEALGKFYAAGAQAAIDPVIEHFFPAPNVGPSTDQPVMIWLEKSAEVLTRAILESSNVDYVLFSSLYVGPVKPT